MASAFGRGFVGLKGKTKIFIYMLFWPIFGHFWCSVVTLITFSSYLNGLKKNPKIPPKKYTQRYIYNKNKIPKFQKYKKIPESITKPNKKPNVKKYIKRKISEQEKKITYFPCL